jgi:hypothetical protein
MDFYNIKLLTVYELACGDVEATASGPGVEINFVSLEPVSAKVLGLLMEMGQFIAERDGDSPDVVSITTYGFA